MGHSFNHLKETHIQLELDEGNIVTVETSSLVGKNQGVLFLVSP
jgi:hypothetical protein